MKRIVFAWVTFMYDFDSEQEAVEFIKNSHGKGWQVDEQPYKQNWGDCWTVRVEKPYNKKYNPGW